VVRSREPFKFWWAPTISLKRTADLLRCCQLRWMVNVINWWRSRSPVYHTDRRHHHASNTVGMSHCVARVCHIVLSTILRDSFVTMSKVICLRVSRFWWVNIAVANTRLIGILKVRCRMRCVVLRGRCDATQRIRRERTLALNKTSILKS